MITNTDNEQLFIMADRIRILVENAALAIDKGLLKVTISSGVTVATNRDDADSIMKRVDALLFLSKASGKNCCMIEPVASLHEKL